MALPVSSSAAPSPRKLLLGQASHREQRLARELDAGPAGPASAASRSGPRTGGSGDVIDSSSGPLTRSKSAVERPPRVAVAGGELRRPTPRSRRRRSTAPRTGRRRSGARARAAQRRQRNPYDSRSSDAHDRRRHPERVERAEHVVHEAGMGELRAADRATRLGLGLEHQHPPSRVGEQVGGDQPVGSGTDHDRVDVAHRSTVPHVRCAARAPGPGMILRCPTAPALELAGVGSRRAGHGRAPRRGLDRRRATSGGSCSGPNGSGKTSILRLARRSSARPSTGHGDRARRDATARSTCGSRAGASGSPAARSCSGCARRSPRTRWS